MKNFINNLNPLGKIILVSLLIIAVLVFIAGLGISYLYTNSILASIGIGALCILFSPFILLFSMVFLGMLITDDKDNGYE